MSLALLGQFRASFGEELDGGCSIGFRIQILFSGIGSPSPSSWVDPYPFPRPSPHPCSFSFLIGIPTRWHHRVALHHSLFFPSFLFFFLTVLNVLNVLHFLFLLFLSFFLPRLLRLLRLFRLLLLFAFFLFTPCPGFESFHRHRHVIRIHSAIQIGLGHFAANGQHPLIRICQFASQFLDIGFQFQLTSLRQLRPRSRHSFGSLQCIQIR
mmetsp:Transcript_8476/g.16245  ORF Transcript_8476/g.16245 Transcript_8476/m.16245 type:complete len:210 (-) Transcript_8476:128-757(-)